MSFDLNCTNDTLKDLIRDNLSWSISGILSFILTFVIFFLLMFHKAYTSILQRLFLYFTMVTLLQLACIAMNIQLQFVFEGGEAFCMWLGFIQHWAYMMNWLFSLTLTFYLHFLVYHQIKGKQLPTIGHKKGLIMEICLVMAVLSLPFTVLWIPFPFYGINGPLCWTRHLLKDCSESSSYTFDLMYTYCCAIVRLLIIASFLVLFVVFCRLACLYRHTRNHYLKTVGRTVSLMFFLIVSALIEIGLLTVLKVNYVILPFSLVIIPAGFMVYLYSLKKFSWESMKKAAQEWIWCCACCNKVKRAIMTRVENREVLENATAPESNRVSAPSETYFGSVPYTGGFTTISKQEQHSIVQKPPINSGYASIIS